MMPAVHHDKFGTTQIANVGLWIAVDQHQVSHLVLGNGADTIVRSNQARGSDRCARQRFCCVEPRLAYSSSPRTKPANR